MAPATVTCPTCGRELQWEGAPFRPFCSERCRLIDLGAWFSEQRAIPGDTAPAEEQAESGERPVKGPPGT
jgi:endogenous inhibitor of DNA gyrase (YacG/DUF329 family)